MKGLKFIVTFAFAAAFLAACAPVSGASPTGGVTPQPPIKQVPTTEPTLPPYDAPLLPPKGALEAQKMLAGRLGIAPEEVTIRDIQSMEWQDSCLGLGGPAESCLQAITPGYQVTLNVNGQDYIYRANAEGTQVRAEDAETSAPNGETGQPGIGSGAVDLPGAILAAIAGRLNVDPGAVTVIEAEQVDWPDACLGIRKAGIACAQVIVPGYRVVVEVNGQSYSFRTDLTGNQVVQEKADVGQGSGSLRYIQQVGNVCTELRIGSGQARMSVCGGAPTVVKLAPVRWTEWQMLTESLAEYSLTSSAVEIEFQGSGTGETSPAEQRSLAAWAEMVIDEAKEGQLQPDRGLIFRWHREGGIAGFCDELAVYESGFAVSSTCKGQVEERGRARLTAEQLEKVFSWLDQYRAFEQEQKDPAVADAMTIKIEFLGAGTQEAPAEIRAELDQLASELFVAAGRTK